MHSYSFGNCHLFPSFSVSTKFSPDTLCCISRGHVKYCFIRLLATLMEALQKIPVDGLSSMCLRSYSCGGYLVMNVDILPINGYRRLRIADKVRKGKTGRINCDALPGRCNGQQILIKHYKCFCLRTIFELYSNQNVDA